MEHGDTHYAFKLVLVFSILAMEETSNLEAYT
jgi:hypothetical protein